VATTRLGQIGVGVQPYPGFDPKDPAPTSGPHDPGLITRLSQFGVGAAKYATFLPKSAAVVPEDDPERNSGGYLPGRGFGLARIGTLRTKDDIREAREKFGVIPRVAKVISQVAAQQADLLSLDEQQRLEHLERELELQGIEYEGHYLDLLNVMRERLIATEIGRRLKELQMLEEETVLILLVAASV